MQLSRSLFAAVMVAVLGVSVLGLTHQNAHAASVNSGDLIRGTSYSAVYYMGADSFRYVFPNQKTYDTWYSNFDGVKFISDADLAKIQIGGNVTYKPGTRMIKIDSDPKTYAVAAGGVLRHVSSEAVAIALYGSTWNKQIDDVPDGFFTNYSIGSAINSASDYDVLEVKGAATSINVDKGLKAPSSINITSGGYSPIDVTIQTGGAVKFTNNDTTKHTVTGDDLSWGTGTLNPGESFTKVFTKKGTYSFYDGYNSQNSGAVYVQ